MEGPGKRPGRRRTASLLAAALLLLAVPAGCGRGRGAAARGNPAGEFGDLLEAPPALFRPTANGATIQWVSRGPAAARVEWGYDAAALGRHREVDGTGPVEVVLDGLEPNRDAFYRCSFRGPADATFRTGPVHRFHTARPTGQPFRVALIADTHGYNTARAKAVQENLRATIARCLEDRPDFVIFLGDEAGIQSAGPDTMDQEHAFDRWRGWRGLFATLLDTVPGFLVLGNHEGEAGFFQGSREDGRGKYFQRWGTIARKRYLCNPTSDTYPEGGENEGWQGDAASPATGGAAEGNRSPLQNYFAWSWGDALFVVIDGHRYTNVGGSTPGQVGEWTLGPAQMAWLERTLSGSRARWKFVIAHHLIGGWDYDLDGKSRETDYKYGRGGGRYALIGEQARITSLMNRTGARFFLYGHDHVFVHQAAEGIDFVCCGRPTFLQPLWWDSPGWREAYGAASSGRASEFLAAIGYVRLSVEPQRVVVEYVRTAPSPDENVRHGPDGIVYRWDTSLPSPRVEPVQAASPR